MTQPSLLDTIDVCEKRHRNSPESVRAHEKVIPGKKAMHEKILNLARARKEYGVTVHEVAKEFNTTPNCVSGRLSELRMTGQLKKSELTRRGAAVLIVA